MLFCLAVTGLMLLHGFWPMNRMKLSLDRFGSSLPASPVPIPPPMPKPNARDKAFKEVLGSPIVPDASLATIVIPESVLLPGRAISSENGNGLETPQPASSRSFHTWKANQYASESFSLYRISTLPVGLSLSSSKNAWRSSERRPWCRATLSMYLRSANCASADSSWAWANPVLAAMSSSLNCCNCLACFLFMRSPRMSAAEPETTVRAISNIVAQSAIDFDISTDIEKRSGRLVEKTRMLVGGSGGWARLSRH